MINVLIKRGKEDQRITHITITGHADFAQHGKDIVCAAVSALAIGAVNSAEKLLQINLQPLDHPKDGGFLSWDVPEIKDPMLDNQLQLLMKALILSLEMIEEEYERYIRVNKVD